MHLLTFVYHFQGTGPFLFRHLHSGAVTIQKLSLKTTKERADDDRELAHVIGLVISSDENTQKHSTFWYRVPGTIVSVEPAPNLC